MLRTGSRDGYNEKSMRLFANAGLLGMVMRLQDTSLFLPRRLNTAIILISEKIDLTSLNRALTDTKLFPDGSPGCNQIEAFRHR